MPWHLRTIIKIFLILIPIYIYVGFRLSRALSSVFGIPISLARITSLAIIALLNLYPVLIILNSWSGNFQDFFTLQNQLNWQDYVFHFPFWIGLIVFVESLPYYLMIDGINLFLCAIKSSFLEHWIKWGSVLKICLVIFFLFFVAVTSYLDTSRVITKEYALPISNLPDDLSNLSLVLFGDVQVDRYTQGKDLANLRLEIQEANADLLFFAGDLVTYGEEFIGQGLDLFCRLNSNLEKISCLGDHDHWSNPERIASGLENCGWKFLRNQHHVIDHNKSKILVTGIVYIYSQRISSENLDGFLNAAPSADLKILLVHQPAKKVIQAAKKYGYDLILAGHTHGGQIVFKPFGYRLTPSRFENEHFSGYKRYDGTSLIITNGIGLTLAPLRYNAPAEISKINLVKE